MIIKNQKNSAKITGNEGAIIHDLLNPAHVGNIIKYSLAHVNLSCGKSTVSHIMKTSEVYYILQGSGIMHIDDNSKNVKVGDAIFVKPGSKQYIENTGKENLEFLCIVEPAWKKDDEIIL